MIVECSKAFIALLLSIFLYTYTPVEAPIATNFKFGVAHRNM